MNKQTTEAPIEEEQGAAQENGISKIIATVVEASLAAIESTPTTSEDGQAVDSSKSVEITDGSKIDNENNVESLMKKKSGPLEVFDAIDVSKDQVVTSSDSAKTTASEESLVIDVTVTSRGTITVSVDSAAKNASELSLVTAAFTYKNSNAGTNIIEKVFENNWKLAAAPNGNAEEKTIPTAAGNVVLTAKSSTAKTADLTAPATSTLTPKSDISSTASSITVSKNDVCASAVNADIPPISSANQCTALCLRSEATADRCASNLYVVEMSFKSDGNTSFSSEVVSLDAAGSQSDMNDSNNISDMTSQSSCHCSLHSVDSFVCRICHTSEQPEKLVSPCLCKGSLSYVHIYCLERWISTSRSTICELCHFQYNTEQRLRYTCLQSLRLWYSRTMSRRALQEDCQMFSLLSLVAFGIIGTLLVGIQYYFVHGYTFGFGRLWTKGWLIFFLFTTVTVYLANIYMLIKSQLTPWYRWWQSARDIKLILEDRKPLNLTQRQSTGGDDAGPSTAVFSRPQSPNQEQQQNQAEPEAHPPAEPQPVSVVPPEPITTCAACIARAAYAAACVPINVTETCYVSIEPPNSLHDQVSIHHDYENERPSDAVVIDIPPYEGANKLDDIADVCMDAANEVKVMTQSNGQKSSTVDSKRLH